MVTVSFDGFAGERVVVVHLLPAASSRNLSADEASPGPAFQPLSNALAPSLLRKWIQDPVERRKLLVLAADVLHREMGEPWAHDTSFAPLFETLLSCFERGDFLLFGEVDLPASAIAPQPGPSRPRPQPQPKKRSWIEVELLDDNGRRVATQLVVTLPDGTKLRPSFPGFVRLDDIDPGTCDIEFPQIDGREWGATPIRR